MFPPQLQRQCRTLQYEMSNHMEAVEGTAETKMLLRVLRFIFTSLSVKTARFMLLEDHFGFGGRSTFEFTSDLISTLSDIGRVTWTNRGPLSK